MMSINIVDKWCFNFIVRLISANQMGHEASKSYYLDIEKDLDRSLPLILAHEPCLLIHGGIEISGIKRTIEKVGSAGLTYRV
jgi:hypothetical protein